MHRTGAADVGLAHRFVPGRAADSPVLVLLHGTGGTPDDLVPLARELDPAAALLAPAGPVSEYGAARWFRRLAEGVFDHDDVRARAGQLAGFVRAARARYGLGDRPVTLVGFSNGANIGAALILLHPGLAERAVLLSSMMPLPVDMLPPAGSPGADLGALRVFLGGGEHDPMAPLASNDALLYTLRERGAAVTVHRHPGGHVVTADELAAAAAWLREA
jgi:phospholipase/carboxylesterase